MADIPVPSDMCPKPLSSAPRSGYAVLTPFLQNQDRVVLGDGNCLFRALSSQITGTQQHHLELRKAIARFEQKNESVFRPLHTTINSTPFSDHLQKMKRSCVWGTLVEILAFSSLFHIDVYVASDTYHPGKPSWVKYSPRTPPTSLTVELAGSTLSSHLDIQKEWIEILHVSQSHFDAVKPLTGKSLKRPMLKETLTRIDIDT